MVGKMEQNSYFNSHPHEEDDNFHGFRTRTQLYFNSHPHEEDDFREHNGRD